MLNSTFALFGGDIRNVPLAAISHHAIPLEDGALFDDERRRVDVAVHLPVAVDLDLLIGHDPADDGAADGDVTDVDVPLDVRALPDDQLILRDDAAIEATVDAHGVLELQLALE